MTATPHSKSSRRLDVADLALEFQSAVISAEEATDNPKVYTEMLTAAATRLTGGMQQLVDDRVAYRLRFIPANDNQPFPGIVSSGDFVRDFTPPDYQIYGIVQAAFLYSLTGMTSAGKTAVLLLVTYCTALGYPLGDREVRKGRVIYSAGENPTDVKMRWIAMSHNLGFDPDDVEVDFIGGTYSIPERIEEIAKHAASKGGVDLVIIDTSAAYFQGDDENSNTGLGGHARDMRKLTELPGKPCVLAATHPVKNASKDNLLPRGGGAFLNEVDGNLTLSKEAEGTRLHWQGKHRGPDFEPLTFSLETVTAPKLVDTKGRSIPTVMAKALTAKDAQEQARTARSDVDDVLLEIRRDGKQSLRDMAERLGWRDKGGKPHKDRARRATDKLKRDKLAVYKANKWKLTADGDEAAADAASEKFQRENAAKLVAGLIEKRLGEDDE